MDSTIEQVDTRMPANLCRCNSCKQVKLVLETKEMPDKRRVCKNGICDNERYRTSGTDF